jgi:Hemingway/CFA97
LKKLIDISEGKSPSTHGPAEYKHRRSFSTFNPKSLNIGARKRDQERIERENFALAKRLYNNTAQIQKHELERSYKENKLIGERIRRVKDVLPGLKLKPISPGRTASTTKHNWNKRKLSADLMNTVSPKMAATQKN